MKRPNIDLNTKPQVTIDLPPVIEAFCRWIFNTPINQKQIITRRNHPIGKIIYARYSSSYTPVKKSFCEHPVTFILPMNKVNHHVLSKHYLYVGPMEQDQIRDELEYQFGKWLDLRFKRGYEMNYDQKTIIEAILRGLNIRNNAANFDAIKKNDYRTRRTEEGNRFNELLKDCRCEL